MTDFEAPYRRKYPRRALARPLSLLWAGDYQMVDSQEVGEGGMAVVSQLDLAEGSWIVLNFRIPGGDFVSVRAIVRSRVPGQEIIRYGVSFENISFNHKRQIRAFVSSRQRPDLAEM